MIIQSPQLTLGFTPGVLCPTGFGKCVACIYCYSIVQSSFTELNILCVPPGHHSLCPNLWPSLILFLPPWFYLSPECLIAGISQSVAFSEWPLLLSHMHVMFLHVFSSLDHSFIFFSFWKYFKFCIGVWLIYNVVLVSGVWQNDSLIRNTYSFSYSFPK